MGKRLKKKPKPKRPKYKALYLQEKHRAEKATENANYFEGVAETCFEALCGFGETVNARLMAWDEHKKSEPAKVSLPEWIALAYFMTTLGRYVRNQNKFDLPSTIWVRGRQVVTE